MSESAEGVNFSAARQNAGSDLNPVAAAFVALGGVKAPAGTGSADNTTPFDSLTRPMVMFAIPLFGLRAVTPRPPAWLRLASLSGLLMTALYIVLSVFPIIKVESVSTFALKITMMIVAMNLVGVAILFSARQRLGKSAAWSR
jgi:hypothetical protein